MPCPSIRYRTRGQWRARLVVVRRAITAAAFVLAIVAVPSACGQVETADRVIIGDPDTLPAPEPSRAPIELPAEATAAPTTLPTVVATTAPSATATTVPTSAPTVEPTAAPTTAPTAEPTIEPTASPEPRPTSAPTAIPAPTPVPGEEATTGDAVSSRADSPAATSTAPPALSPLEAAVANLEARGAGVAMPSLVCHDLQRAQNILQALTDEFFATDTVDASGDDRRQVWDRNWVVTAQAPEPGERIVGDPLLSVLKDDESECGPEPAAIMFDLTCLPVDRAQDLLQAQTGRFFASELIDASARDRTPILRGRWFVVGQEPAAGEPIVDSTKPRLRVLHRDETDVCRPI